MIYRFGDPQRYMAALAFQAEQALRTFLGRMSTFMINRP
jgi:hypothetical protein